MSRRMIPLLFLCLAALPAWAVGGERYVVGVEELDYYPAYAVRDGAYTGAAREILDAFAADEGITLEYRPLPVARLTAGLLSGQLDAKFPDHPDWSREARRGKAVVYSRGVIAYVDGVMVRPEAVGRRAEAVRTLGTVSGFTPFAWQELLAQGRVRLVENPHMRALQRQVIAGRLDGAYANVAVARHILEHELGQPGALVFDAGLPHVRGEYLLSSVRRPELVHRFDRWLEDNADRVAGIRRQYGVGE